MSAAPWDGYGSEITSVRFEDAIEEASLLPHHRKMLADSGIDPEVVRERGYRSLGAFKIRDELARLEFTNSQIQRIGNAGGLLVPVHTVEGRIGLVQFRPDRAGPRAKYETPSGHRLRLDVPPRARLHLADPNVPLWVTEGAKKADSAVTQGLCCIALLGVYGWRGTNDDGGTTVLGDWESIALNGRRVYLAFDSDAMVKREVNGALARLSELLRSRGAEVLFVYLPSGPRGEKQGLDDYFGSGGTVQELVRDHVTDELRAPAQQDDSEADEPNTTDRLQVHNVADVLAEPDTLGWAVEGWWPQPSYGNVAGPEKSLKSYMTTLVALSVASGQPFLGVAPVQQGPVVVFSGEGSRQLWARRARHLARGMGIDSTELAGLPIRITDQSAPMLSPKLLGTLDDELSRGPALVIIDPLYAYHGADREASNIHQAAEVLNAASDRTQSAGASLMIVNHFNKTGAKNLSLSSITQAGGREWSDSWWLLGHVEPPDLAAQRYTLEVRVGSRQWGGASYTVGIDLTPFDRRTFTHVGTPSWYVTEDDAGPTSPTDVVLLLLRDGGMVEAALVRGVMTTTGVRKADAERAILKLSLGSDGQPPSIMRGPVQRVEGARTVTREGWVLRP